MKLSRLNTLLLCAILTLNLYVVLTPFVPQLLFWANSHNGQQARLQKTINDWKHVKKTAASEPNHLVIPAMQLDQPVLEGIDTYAILNKGIWRWPDGSTPDKDGNTIFIGHRFTYTNPEGVFYFLDKMKIGDEIGVVWNNVHYIYTVNSVKIVSPSHTEILNQTDKPTITLYTCTPLWWPKDRLVVTAERESIGL